MVQSLLITDVFLSMGAWEDDHFLGGSEVQILEFDGQNAKQHET